MKEYLDNFGEPVESNNESQDNGIQNENEDIQNYNFQAYFQNNYFHPEDYEPNYSSTIQPDFYPLNAQYPMPEEDIVSQQNINTNSNNNQRNDAIFNQSNNIAIINPMSITTFNTTKKGRKNKNSTEKGDHTTYSPDNRRELYWRLFMNYILLLSNSFSFPDKMESPNFIQQYGGNCIDKNERFLNLKIYQYFSYNTFYCDDKEHKKTGTKNLGIIKKMVFEKKNEAYIAIMKSTIEEMFESFKNNEKYIIKNDKVYYLPDFKTIDDAYIEIQNDLEEENILSAEEIQNEFDRFENLVNYIKIKGQETKRKEKCSRKITYITIPELEAN